MTGTSPTGSKRRADRRRRLIQNGTLLLLSIALSLAMLETISRAIFPVSSGVQLLTLAGERIRLEELRLRPNFLFRQVSNEYDVLTTTTAHGNRVSFNDGNPEIIFLGDSFTFGTGVSDEDTFPHIYCRGRNVACANLGRPGISTAAAGRILRHYLEAEGWRPREVKLFVVAMTASLSPGNDLYDNLYDHDAYIDYKVPEGRVLPKSSPLVGWEIMAGARRELIERSNLARLALLVLGPYLRSVTPSARESTVVAALNATQKYIEELGQTASRYGFTLNVYIIHPIQDVRRGTYKTTARLLAERIGFAPVVSTAPAVLDKPEQYYYRFDGHFNPRGSRAIAEMLLARDMASSDPELTKGECLRRPIVSGTEPRSAPGGTVGQSNRLNGC